MFLGPINIMVDLKEDRLEQEKQNFERMLEEFRRGEKYQEFSGLHVAVYKDKILNAAPDLEHLKEVVFRDYSGVKEKIYFGEMTKEDNSD